MKYIVHVQVYESEISSCDWNKKITNQNKSDMSTEQKIFLPTEITCTQAKKSLLQTMKPW